jgi:Uma2 family endonuclease
MNIINRLPTNSGEKDVPIIAIDMPVMYEDEGQDEMGETSFHELTIKILSMCLANHLKKQALIQVFSNLNVYYHLIDRWAYFSPDVMVVRPFRPLEGEVTSYRIGEDGPAPVLVIEVLSRRSAQQQDLTNKPILYAQHGIAEYMLVNVTGEFLPQRLWLKRLLPDQTWVEGQDADGGVTSQLGFRVVLEGDGQVRVVDTATGHRYVRPDEAEERIQAEAEARRQAQEARLYAEARVRELEERLREVEEKPAKRRKKPKK